MSGYLIRPIQPDDLNYVFSAWLEGHWVHYPGRVTTPKHIYWDRWHRIVENILADERTRTVVAEYNGALMGFASGRPPSVLHWVDVKPTYSEYLARKTLIAACLNGVVTGMRSHWDNEFDGHFEYHPSILREYAE